MEEKKVLKYRMYGLVMYNLSDIQKGIQFAHSIEKYIWNFGKEDERYKDYYLNDKTHILLSGGTSNDMKEHNNFLGEIGYLHANFYEPDLNDSLSAISFLVDERVWDRENYPDKELWCEMNGYHCISYDVYIPGKPSPMSWGEGETKWVEFIGGEQNVKLREFLKGKRLA